MTKREYLEKVNNQIVDNKKVSKISAVYGTEIPEIIQRIVSGNSKSIFFEDGTRIISYYEMLSAKEDLHIDFEQLKMIPVADCGENDFIVFHFSTGKWSKYNIIEEIVFKRKDTLGELL